MSTGRHRQSPPPRRGRGRHRQPPPRSRMVVPAVTVTALMAAGGGVAYALSQSDSTGAPPSASVGVQATVGVTPPTALLLPTATAATPSGTPTHPSTPSGPARHTTHRVSHPAALRLHVRGAASYVEVSRHGRLIEQTILHPGQRQVFRRHGLDVVLGNAGAVVLSIDGHRTHRAGHSGQVLRFFVR